MGSCQLWTFLYLTVLLHHSASGYDLRLVGGHSRCQGRLQFQWTGQEWTEVAPWQYSVPQRFGRRVCADLDCGRLLTLEKKKVPQRKAVSVSPFECEDTSLVDCFSSRTHRHDDSLQLNCSDSVRLVSGPTSCSGSLQIWDQSLDRTWTPVCEGALDHRGAEVLCRELGCGAPRLEGVLPPLGQMFHCEGHEAALMNCPRNQTGPGTWSGPALKLTCSEPLRLVGGASRCEGTVEAELEGEWRRVMTYNTLDTWDLESAATVCRDLGCGSVVSTEKRRGLNITNMWKVRPDCVKKSSVRECIYDGFYGRDEGLHVVCSDSVRLVSGRTSCSGSLQVWNQSWTPVCEGALARRGAEVVCRELGCGAPLLQGALSPLGPAFHCEGHESALKSCPRNQTRTDPGTCSGPALNLTCSEPLRLVGGASRCEGTLEAELRGEWRRVRTFFRWGLEFAAAVCRDLDCGSAVSTENRRRSSITDVWLVDPYCMKKSSVRECLFDASSVHDDDLKVVCSDSVRLVSGWSLCSGSLQFWDRSLDQSWAPVCEEALGHRGAEVVCRELGCGAPLLQGAVPPQGQTFHCEGHEPALRNCPRVQTRTDSGICSGPGLNFTCSEPLRLVGGASRCEGTVEAELRGEWRRVVPSLLTGSWDLESAAAVCRGLDCGSAVSTKEKRDLNITDVWTVSSDCVRRLSVRECVFDGLSGRDVGLEVVCSGKV